MPYETDTVQGMPKSLDSEPLTCIIHHRFIVTHVSLSVHILPTPIATWEFLYEEHSFQSFEVP